MHAIMKRVNLTPVGEKDGDLNVTCDVMVGESGVPYLKMASFGVLGGFKESSETLLPFVLRPNGDVDFGTEFEDDEYRYGKTNLLSGRVLEVGELFTFRYDGNDYTYRVARIFEM